MGSINRQATAPPQYHHFEGKTCLGGCISMVHKPQGLWARWAPGAVKIISFPLFKLLMILKPLNSFPVCTVPGPYGPLPSTIQGSPSRHVDCKIKYVSVTERSGRYVTLQREMLCVRLQVAEWVIWNKEPRLKGMPEWTGMGWTLNQLSLWPTTSRLRR